MDIKKCFWEVKNNKTRKWCAWPGGDKNAYEIGVEFESLSDEDQKFIYKNIKPGS